MKKNKEGYVIAFHNDEERHPYQGLSCRERAIKKFKPKLAEEVVKNLFMGKTEEVLKKISLEAGIVDRNPEVLDFIVNKVQTDEPIFLYLREEDVVRHNENFGLSHFAIASVWVTREEFTFLNPEAFDFNEQADIIALVIKSQTGTLSYVSSFNNEMSKAFL